MPDSPDQHPDAPKIEFPCDYPITVMGDAAEDFEALVVEVVKRHDPDLDTSLVRMRHSSHGRFSSVRVIIRATGKDQLQALHHELQATGRVKIVL